MYHHCIWLHSYSSTSSWQKPRQVFHLFLSFTRYCAWLIVYISPRDTVATSQRQYIKHCILCRLISELLVSDINLHTCLSTASCVGHKTAIGFIHLTLLSANCTVNLSFRGSVYMFSSRLYEVFQASLSQVVATWELSLADILKPWPPRRWSGGLERWSSKRKVGCSNISHDRPKW